MNPNYRNRFVVTLIVLILMGFSHSLNAQPTAALPDNFLYRSWNNTSGLPQNTVYDMVQDGEGYLWGATEEGLFRFDGSQFNIIDQFTTPALPSHTFYDLLPVGKDLWASGRNIVVRIRNKVQKIWELGDLVSGGWIRVIEQDSANRIWIGTTTGRLFYIEKDSVYAYKFWPDEYGSIETIKYTPSGLFIGTSRGLFQLKDSRSAPIQIPELAGISITAITTGRDRELWIGSSNRGLYRYDGDTIHYTTAQNLKQNTILSLYMDGSNRLWIGFLSAGFQVLEKAVFKTPKQDPYDHDGIRTIYTDGDDEVWLGTNSSGLVLMTPAQIISLPPTLNLTNKVILPIYQHSSGEIWVGTAGRGLQRILNGASTEYNQSSGLSGNLVLTITGRGDYIFVGTNGGLDRINRITGKIDKQFTTANGLLNNSILCLMNDSAGRLWVTTRGGGLQWIDESDSVHVLNLPAAVRQANLICLFEDRQQNIWIGTRNSGMLSLRPNGEFIHYAQDQGLMGDIVYSFFQDQEADIWLGTEKGLVVFSSGTFKLFNTAHGLRFNEVYRMLEDPRGFIWVSGNLGLQRISLNEMMNIKNYGMASRGVRARLFNAFDGMPNSETNGGFYPAGWKMLDGTLWFPTVNGVAVVDHNMIREESSELDMHIESLRYSDQEFYPGQHIKIPPGVYNIEIRYTSIDFSKAADIRYYYRLRGLTDEWTEAGNRHIAFFSALEPGNYEFEVKAERYGYFSPTATISFRTLPQFYKTTWFKIFVAALGLMTIAAVFLSFRLSARRRLREQQRITMAQIHGQEKERQFISTELHDSVNQQLTTAKLFLDFAKSNEDMSRDLMLKSEVVIQSVINNIRTLCNSLTPPSLKDIGLKEALEDLAASYATVSRFKIHWTVDLDFSDLPEELQFTLFRIIQEQMQNIVRHSSCSNIWLKFSTSGHTLHVSIRDDGVGFDPKTQRFGLGFENIKNRLVLFDGKMEIKSAPGKGCTLLLSIPLKKPV